MMHWTPISVLQSLILPMSISRLVCNCFEVAKAMECLDKTVLHCLKMFILRPIKLQGRLDRQDLNGEIQLLNLRPKDPPPDQRTVGQEADLLKSTRHPSLQTPLIREPQIVDKFHLHHERLQVLQDQIR